MTAEFKENIDIVVEYTKKFIDAATPVAKQAYDIGLTVVRIDAVTDITFGLVSIILIIYICKNWEKWDGTKDKYDICTAKSFAGGVGFVVSSVIACFTILNIWMWVKLFRPDLWLAHEAIKRLTQ